MRAPLLAATLPPQFSESVNVSGLSAPVGLAFLPDGRLLVIEQAGRVRLAVNDVLRTQPVLDITGEVRFSGEQGLLGVAMDPGYPARPYLYLYYNNRTPNLQYVVRYTLTGTLSDSGSDDLSADAASRVFLLTDIPNNATNHNGGTLRFGPDGLLYLSMGDDAAPCDAQNRTILKGVILRIKVDDSITIDPNSKIADKASLAPATNPWAASANLNEKLVWAYGLRNPFRFNFDPQTGSLFIGDVGQSVKEEIDRSEGGENFGWPYWEGTVQGPNTGCGGENGVQPIFDVNNPPARSIIGGPGYRGTGYPTDRSFPPEYEGVVFFTEFYTGFLKALRQNTGGAWELVSPMGLAGGDFGAGLVGPSDLVTGPDGALYYTALAQGEVRSIGYEPSPGAVVIIDDGGGGKSGCSLSSNGDFDPVLPLLLAFALGYLRHRKRRLVKKLERAVYIKSSLFSSNG